MKVTSTLFALSLCIVALMACSTGTDGGNESGSSAVTADASPPATISTHTRAVVGDGTEHADGKRIGDRDGTATAVVPTGWTLVPDTIRGSLISAASFLPPEAGSGGGLMAPCRPGRLLDAMPPGEALIRIWEHIPGPGSYRPADSKRRPPHIKLPARRTHECGHSYELTFRDRGRTVAIWVWADSLTPETRRQLLSLINGLALAPADSVPVYRPWMALDCGNPPNSLECDRVYVFVTTRVPMRSLSVLLLDPTRTDEQAVRLRAASARGRADGPKALPPRTVWTGVLRDVGFRRKGGPLEIPIPAQRNRWLGIPRVAADLGLTGQPVEGRAGHWVFRNVPLLAGHG